MSQHEEKEIQYLVSEALEREPQRRFLIRTCPGAGMSHANIFWLLKFLEKQEEGEWQRHSLT